jgi:hypothetical protein
LRKKHSSAKDSSSRKQQQLDHPNQQRKKKHVKLSAPPNAVANSKHQSSSTTVSETREQSTNMVNKRPPQRPVTSANPQRFIIKKSPTAKPNEAHKQNVFSIDLPPIYYYGYSETFIRWCRGLTLSVLTTFGLVALGQQLVQQPQQETTTTTLSSTTAKPLVMTTDNLVLNDEWISVWQKRNNGRLLYLLGTMHGSQRSMDTAQQLVESIRPKAVFVELDVNRLDANELQLPTPIPAAVVINERVAKTDAVGLETTINSNLSKETVTWIYPRTVTLAEKLWHRIIYGKQSVVQFEQQTLPCHSSIPSSSSENKSTRVTDPSEFNCAIWAGQKHGAVIILGDQHIRVTNSRLILGGLLDFLYVLFYERAKESIKRAKQQNSRLNKEERKEEEHKEEKKEEDASDTNDYFNRNNFDRIDGTREDIRNKTSLMQQIVPGLYRALVMERDDCMAAYLNSLEQYETTVALVGKGHVDGIEERLAKQGWEPVKVVSVVKTKEQGTTYWWRW